MTSFECILGTAFNQSLQRLFTDYMSAFQQHRGIVSSAWLSRHWTRENGVVIMLNPEFYLNLNSLSSHATKDGSMVLSEVSVEGGE